MSQMNHNFLLQDKQFNFPPSGAIGVYTYLIVLNALLMFGIVSSGRCNNLANCIECINASRINDFNCKL